ncbi:hypothetical protein chiPu_0022067 [Chiloscyllium punctatum]|uniref:Uncharacterized protein n=1 Tax=Chiloscyllium punctatum TaxID=137246 RepID=A0A401RJD1_CHIPU|nr:hypothetical protein [Chiloscyllium punctatum]
MIISDAAIDNKEARKITLKTLQEMVNEQARRNVELVQEEGHCMAVVASGPEGNSVVVRPKHPGIALP